MSKLTFAEFLGGTYVEVKPVGGSLTILENWFAQNGPVLNDPVPINSLHTTLLHSTKPISVISPSIEYNAKPNGFALFDGENGDKCLVLLLRCDMLERRHATLVKQGASRPSHPYRPHITLSYNETPEVLTKLSSLDVNILLGNESTEKLVLKQEKPTK